MEAGRGLQRGPLQRTQLKLALTKNSRRKDRMGKRERVVFWLWCGRNMGQDVLLTRTELCHRMQSVSKSYPQET